MSRYAMLGWACAALAVASCIQRKLVCPPLAESGSSSSAVSAKFGTVLGVSLLGQGGLKAFAVHGDSDKVDVRSISTTGQAFTDALRAQIKKSSGHEWAVQLQTPTTRPVDEGDALLATFYLRAEKPLDETGTGQTQFVFEESGEPYAKSVIYEVEASTEWRKIYVPFIAKRHFGPGEAQMIFRLGYEPEIIDIGGVTIDNFGKKLSLAALPTTPRWSPPTKAEAAIPIAPIDGGILTVDVDAMKAIEAISPYVYGVNAQSTDGLAVTVRRMGGNRQTAYNWEINASNAGSDYRHVSDDWPCSVLGYRNCNEPGAQVVDFALENKSLGAETLATIPLVDYVAADKHHDVSEPEKAPSKRWIRSFARKDGPYVSTPALDDGAVYEDEFVNFLVHKLGTAAHGGIAFYSLDNEPALWPSTHPRVHPEKTTYQEMLSRSEATASAITTIDPTALVLGGVMYGWSEFLSLQDAPDSKETNARYDTYVDYFLASMKTLEQKHHRRLVHVLDVHWYPEAKGTKRVTEDDVSPRTVDARLQAPRALWDPTYREKSWIDDSWGKPIRLIPWLREKIAKRYPGTKVSMTEYNFGAGGHISGGLAQVDVLGALGREGVFVANYWGQGAGNGSLPAYVAAAFKLYRNYDGKGGTFGDTAVAATVADPVRASVYAATDSKRHNVLTVVVINKDQRAAYAGKLVFHGPAKYAMAQAYELDGTSPELRPTQRLDIKNNQLDYALPPLSATLFVCERR
ncbi:MAG: glycoside hydrolase family 44 protein [Myxococcota bacterium]|nr:glycoside hydrolase family 44 protein [Myxococcota bacterium]